MYFCGFLDYLSRCPFLPSSICYFFLVTYIVCSIYIHFWRQNQQTSLIRREASVAVHQPRFFWFLPKLLKRYCFGDSFVCGGFWLSFRRRPIEHSLSVLEPLVSSGFDAVPKFVSVCHFWLFFGHSSYWFICPIRAWQFIDSLVE